MNKDGKYDREDLVRFAQAAFGPCIEVDHAAGQGYYVDLYENDGPLRQRKVARILDAKDANALTRKVLDLAGVKHDSRTETSDGKSYLVWERTEAVIARVRARREVLTGRIREKLTKESSGATNQAE